MAVTKIVKNNFEELVLKSGKTVLLDFYADWCGPCKMLAPAIHEIADENPDIIVGQINVDEENELAMQFKIVSIPALFVIKDGEVSGSIVGYTQKEKILALLK